MIEIEKLKGGYILHDNRPASERRIITTTEELFTELLQIVEGRAYSFHGDLYGKVSISREEPKS